MDDTETDIEGLSRYFDMDDVENIEGKHTSSHVSNVQATVYACRYIPPIKVTPAIPEHPSSSPCNVEREIRLRMNKY